MPSRLFLFACAALGLAASARAAAPPRPLSFERDVRPVLKAYCLDCHGGEEKLKGGLDLRLKRFAVKGGRNGPAVVPGRPDASLLIQRVRGGEMPPGEKKVPADLVAVLERWVATGAHARPDEPEKLPPGLGLTAEERAYWFFQPVRRPAAPTVAAAGRVRTPVDAFVLAKLEAAGLTFAPDADPLTLMRRATLDLTGLPPSPDEADAYLADERPDRYERLIDRLLSSPAYGERWARHWLDAAGYSDDADSWRYRDWVVRALNADKPLDRFVVEQLAGDELVPLPWDDLTAAQADLLAATGFLRTAPDGEAGDAERVVADAVKIVSSSLLGLSVGCAQCHDHRYDPIPQADYFRFRAVFEPAFGVANWRPLRQRRASLYTTAERSKASEVEAVAAKMQAELNAKQQAAVKEAFDKELLKFPAEQRDALRAAFDAPNGKRTPEQTKLVAANPKLNLTPGVLYQFNPKAADELEAMAGKVAAKRAERPPEGFVGVVTEEPNGRVPVTRIHHRGDPRQPLAAVGPGDLTVTAPEGRRLEIAPKQSGRPTTGRRLAYAKHLTSGEHPLLGRVLMNRVWLNHFGRGIVDTPGDFGVLGQRPTHPELLDWLSTELVRRGWSMKEMHRLLMASTAYRQSSRRDAAQDRLDGGNALYGRFLLRRLEAEAIRDRALAAAGRLDRAVGGPAVAAVEDVSGQVSAPDDRPRRSLYLQARRGKPLTLLGAFDAPASELNCDRRSSSTVAPQALMLMNGDFFRRQAKHFARSLLEATPAGGGASEATALPADAWSYGHGEYDPMAKRTKSFAPLPHWTGTTWQGGPALPDAKLGWAILHARGGHAGDDQARAVVRRWVAPEAGTLSVTGTLRHPSPHGDGVRGRVVGRAASEWTVKSGEKKTDVTLEVSKGDAVDFVVDCIATVSSDSFEWPVRLTLNGRTWDSAADFAGPRASAERLAAEAWRRAYQRPATPDELRLAAGFVARQAWRLRGEGRPDAEAQALANLCQQLLASNEALYLE